MRQREWERGMGPCREGWRLNAAGDVAARRPYHERDGPTARNRWVRRVDVRWLLANHGGMLTSIGRHLKAIVTLPVLATVFLSLVTGQAESEALYGFSPSNSVEQIKLEAAFRAVPEPGNLRQYMERLSAHPHNVGSPYDRENAEWIRAQMTAWGWKSSIESFDVLYPTPRSRLIEMTEPVH